MSIDSWLQQNIRQLESAGILTARLDCLVLLEDILARDRSWILAHTDHTLEQGIQSQLSIAVQRRTAHEPLAYIRGHAEFYGYDFAVNHDVLVPRPESETVIDILKTWASNNHPSHIVDIGTGSGCLAITAALQTRNTNVLATDSSTRALKIARQNATKLNAEVEFFEGDLAQPIIDKVDKTPYVLLCNLPYVPAEYPINQAAKHEPGLALFGGNDGLDLYRELFDQLDDAETKPSAIICESLPEQHVALAELAASHGFRLADTQDFIQLFS